MNVSQIMSRTVATCGPDDTLACAAGKMWDHDVGALPVVAHDGRVIAMITDRDAAMSAFTQGRPLHEIQVSVAMSRGLWSCRPGDTIIQAEEIMREHRLRRLPVLDDSGNLAGVVTLNDVAREADREAGQKARAVSVQEVAVTLAAVCEPHRKAAITIAA